MLDLSTHSEVIFSKIFATLHFYKTHTKLSDQNQIKDYFVQVVVTWSIWGAEVGYSEIVNAPLNLKCGHNLEKTSHCFIIFKITQLIK